MNGYLIQAASAPSMGNVVAIVLATAFPLAFIAQLLWSEFALAARRIALTGKPPIDGPLFFSCKCLAIGAWFAVALQSIGLGWRPFAIRQAGPAVPFVFWVVGFGLLFLGRIGLSADFRLGLPNESTLFRRAGVFRFTRNPMYAGIDLTMIAAVLYTGNPALLATGAFVIGVQHRIIRAEELWLQSSFGDEYRRYRERVGRYVTLPLGLRSRARALFTLMSMGHCAPTVMCSMLAACGLKADWLIRLASALPGGIGNTGAECGGITSPLVLLGLVHGLDGAEGGLPRVFDRSCNHIEKFRKSRGSILCHEIRRRPNQILPCIKAVAQSGGICAKTVCCESADILGDGTRAAYSRLYAAFRRRDFHCARTVLRCLAGRIPEEKLLLKASSAFLGGTSFAGMTCSALTAGAMALGLGMGEIERSPFRVFRMVILILAGGQAFRDDVNKFNGAMNRGGELATWFAARYGSTQCRAITKADFASVADVDAYVEGDGITRCQRIAESVADRVRVMLGEVSAARAERA